MKKRRETVDCDRHAWSLLTCTMAILKKKTTKKNSRKKNSENMVQSKRTLIMVHLIAIDSRIRIDSIKIQIKRITFIAFFDELFFII